MAGFNSKSTAHKPKKSTGKKEVERVEYRKPDKGKGAISRTHFRPKKAGGSMTGVDHYQEPEEEIHADKDSAHAHLDKMLFDEPGASSEVPAAGAEDEGAGAEDGEGAAQAEEGE